jgi:flagellar biosynthesis protein FlhF
MKIKRYTASSMRAALAVVRAEQGPDAVILSSRRGDEGVEVIAAIDYDEGLFTEAKRQATATPPVLVPGPEASASAAPPRATAPTPARRTPAPAQIAPAKSALQPAAAPEPTAASHTAAAPQPAAAPPARPTPPRPDFGYALMKREMQEIRQLLQTGMAGLTWSDKRLREPLKAQVLEHLSALDIAPDVASSIAEHTPRRGSPQERSNMPLALLLSRLQFVDDTTTATGGITALVGPTGAGKTTTIAKLAARWCLLHGNRDLALISTDAYRIGAREQLMTYARILDAPMHTANSGKQLALLLERLSEKKLILIDTAGMGPRDARLTEQLAALKLGAADAKVLLALPAQAESQALEQIVRAYAPAKPSACIITKIDEASSLGGVLSVAIRHQLKIAYVCDGQRVPDDMHAAQQRRIWLAKLAQQMTAGAPRVRDEAYLARHFGGGTQHA